MAEQPRAVLSIRAIFFASMTAIALYVATIGAFIVRDLAPAAAVLEVRTAQMGAEYDSIGARSALLRNAVLEVQRLSVEAHPTTADRQRVKELGTELSRVAEQAAGVQANMLLHVSPDMRVALAEAASAESQLAGSLVAALDNLGHGDQELARKEVSHAEAARDLLIARLEAAQRVGIASMAEAERTLGTSAHRVSIAIEIWLVLGLIGLGIIYFIAHRHFYRPMADLDAGLAQVANGDLAAALPVSRNDEFGRLAATFNQMTSVLRTRTEIEALRQSESRFRALIEQAPTAIFVSRDGKGLYANHAWGQLFGFKSSEEIIGRPLLDFYAPQCREERRARLQRLHAGLLPVPDEFESIGLRADGSQFVMHVSNSPTVLPDGRATLSFIADISQRREAEAALQRLLLDKEALLREVHHRVKNNLQLIASLLHLEGARSTLAETKAVLEGMHGRIRSIARLHESLTHTESHSSVDLGAYLKELTSEIVGSLVTSPSTVKLGLDLDSVPIAMDRAMPCGLLVNELVTNSLKHGFANGRTGEVRVDLHRVDEGRQLCLRVSDNGVGLPADILLKGEASLGLQLVSDLVEQLGGTLEIGPPPAAVFTVTFPVTKRA